MVYIAGGSIYQVYTWYILPWGQYILPRGQYILPKLAKNIGFFDFFVDFHFFPYFLPKKRISVFGTIPAPKKIMNCFDFPTFSSNIDIFHKWTRLG